jgi:hypothetical protein
MRDLFPGLLTLHTIVARAFTATLGGTTSSSNRSPCCREGIAGRRAESDRVGTPRSGRVRRSMRLTHDIRETLDFARLYIVQAIVAERTY